MTLARIAARVVAEGAALLRKQFEDSAIGKTVPVLQPGESAIVGQGKNRVGVFCDSAGELHAVLARCTHIDWELDFNPEGQSWDCPRHGARFSIDGAVLHGPATDPLGTVCLSADLCSALTTAPIDKRRKRR
ncbi:Rieske 2Fe-2S domain-containing protein [Nocardia sp. NPDC051756]|uniref:Rieske 2Fe-2S domain-containing protein n=1 Tax=Nocardia sp. NPDC051756 TaxID=3154751 RepID=UPI003421F198